MNNKTTLIKSEKHKIVDNKNILQFKKLYANLQWSLNLEYFCI